MPTYDYQCGKCQHTFEKFQGIKEKPEAKCPKCGGKARRLISAGAGIIFKGSGFYETDYKKKKTSEKPSACPLDKNKPACGSCGGGVTK